MSKRVTKSCVVCGLEKPLTAYLQITGPQGSSYGNVCSTCRGSGLGKKVVIPHAEDEHSSSSTGLKIDAKKRLKVEIDHKLKLEQTRDLDHKEKQKTESVTDEKSERVEEKKESEKRHRQDFIEGKKKGGFLDNLQKKTFQNRVSQEKAATAKSFLDHTIKVEEAVKTKEIATTIDVSDAPSGSEAKYQSEAFLRFIDERMAGTSIHAARHQFSKKTNPAEQKQKTEEKNKLVEYIKDTWEPKPPGSRR